MNGMLRKNFLWFLCGGLGVFHFILMCIPYVAAYAEFGSNSTSEGASGYKVFDMWDLGFSGVMSSLVQIFILIVAIALIALAVIALLKEFGVADVTGVFNNLKLGGAEGKQLDKLGEYGLLAYAGLNILLFVFLIIVSLTNKESYFGATMGIKLSAGIFITLVFAIGAVVALRLVEKKFPMGENAVITIHKCSKCGKKVKASIKFCPECGGEIIETQPEPKPVYVCSGCGASAKKGVNFCSGCGGQIVQK